MTTLPATGLHHNVTVEDYNSWPAVRHSALKQMDPTPAHCRHALLNPTPPTAAMRLGSALNARLLEPAKWSELYVAAPDWKKPTAAQLKAKSPSDETLELVAKWEAWQRDNSGREALDPDDMALVEGMADGVLRNRMARRLIESAGSCEVSALWRDDATGLMCKARYDKLRPVKPLIIELKSALSANPLKFASQIAKLHYDSQAASYLDAHKLLTGEEAMHVFVVVENTAPHECAVYTLNDQDIQSGRLRYREWLTEYASCVKSGVWPGYAEKVETISMPYWAQQTEPQAT